MNKPRNQAEFPTPEVTTRPLAGSSRVYTNPAAAPHLNAPHREIELHPTAMEPTVGVYDCSGVSTQELQGRIEASHAIVAQGLTKKTRAELGL